jgi:hypothetical protein
LGRILARLIERRNRTKPTPVQSDAFQADVYGSTRSGPLYSVQTTAPVEREQDRIIGQPTGRRGSAEGLTQSMAPRRFRRVPALGLQGSGNSKSD